MGPCDTHVHGAAAHLKPASGRASSPQPPTYTSAALDDLMAAEGVEYSPKVTGSRVEVCSSDATRTGSPSISRTCTTHRQFELGAARLQDPSGARRVRRSGTVPGLPAVRAEGCALRHEFLSLARTTRWPSREPGARRLPGLTLVPSRTAAGAGGCGAAASLLLSSGSSCPGCRHGGCRLRAVQPGPARRASSSSAGQACPASAVAALKCGRDGGRDPGRARQVYAGCPAAVGQARLVRVTLVSPR